MRNRAPSASSRPDACRERCSAGLYRQVVVNDRGVQMKAKEVKQMLTDLGLTQTFSRPRTPNDNPFIESFFSSLKRAPVYPGRFSHLDERPVMDFFEWYFRWYNTEHYHSRIGYLTPEQRHQGLAAGIIAERKRALGEQQKLRKCTGQQIKQPEAGCSVLETRFAT